MSLTSLVTEGQGERWLSLTSLVTEGLESDIACNKKVYILEQNDSGAFKVVRS